MTLFYFPSKNGSPMFNMVKEADIFKDLSWLFYKATCS